MVTFKQTKKMKDLFSKKDVVIVQHLPSGSYDDYFNCNSLEEAFDLEKNEWWVKDHPGGLEEARREFLSGLNSDGWGLEEYDAEDIIAAAEKGEGWPMSLALIEEIEDEE
jgi:hypothetical protein